MKKLSKEQPASSVVRPIVVKSVVDPFDGLDEILDPKHDTSIGVVDVQEDDLDVIDYDSFGSDLEDGIDFKRRIQLRELRRIGKQKNKGPNKYYFYLGQQFASKEIVKGRVKKHSVETRRQLILVKNDNERVRVRCEGTIPTLVPYVAIDTNMDKNVFSQTKGGPGIRKNINSGKHNILGKDKTMEGKDHVIKSLATNPDIPVRAVQDQMQKQFEVEVSKMKAFRAKRIASDIMTGSYRSLWERNLGLDGASMSVIDQCQYSQQLGVDAKQWDLSIGIIYRVEAEKAEPMKWELTEIPCKHVVALIYNMFKNSVGVGIPEQWVHAAYRLETWARVYSFKVNPCNGRDMWLLVESRTVIIPSFHKPPIGRPPKKRNKSNDDIRSQSASSGKLSRKGKSISCGKCGNVGHNKKGCRGQGGGFSQAGARKVSSQAAGSRKVSGQAASVRNVSGQAVGVSKALSQPSAA
ncbi:mutator type transposase [Tanacetum coccineum]